MDPEEILRRSLTLHGHNEHELRFMIEHLSTASTEWYTLTYGEHIGKLVQCWGNMEAMLETNQKCILCRDT